MAYVGLYNMIISAGVLKNANTVYDYISVKELRPQGEW